MLHFSTIKPKSLCALTLIFMLSINGCQQNAPALVPLEGVVLLKGEPLTAGSIHFHPDVSNADAPKDIPSSLLQTDGSFSAKTFPYGEGIAVGTYRVTLSPSLASRIKKPKLANPESSPWSITIPESGVVGHTFIVDEK